MLGPTSPLKKSGAEDSGIEPLEYNVLVRPYRVPEVTAGGLHLPQVHHERKQWAETRGTVLAISATAFSFEAGAEKPEIGDEILCSKNAGQRVTGADGEEYRLIKDQDVMAILRGGDDG